MKVSSKKVCYIIYKIIAPINHISNHSHSLFFYSKITVNLLKIRKKLQKIKQSIREKKYNIL